MEPFTIWITGTAGAWALGRTLDQTNSFAAGVLRRISDRGTDFLNHDPRYVNQVYAEVGPKLAGSLPYLEIADFSDDIRQGRTSRIMARVNTDPFFTQATDFEWAQARAQAYLDYRSKGYAASDSPVMRIESATKSDNALAVEIRPTRYFCQAESNLVLDKKTAILSHEKKQVTVTLRQLLSAGQDLGLPRLDDKRLANSLGVVVCFLSKDRDGRIALRMVKRTKDVGVFPGGVHPAMSCAIKWDHERVYQPKMDLMDVILPDIQREMVQETGLDPSQYSTPIPLSFCREFLRGGKPQLFCLSYTDLPQHDLNAARDRQMKTQRAYRPEKVELLGSGWLSAHDPSAVIGGRLPGNLTHEGAAAFHLVNRLFAGVETQRQA